MADIDVSCVNGPDGWLCQVRIDEHGSETRHSVALTRTDFQRLAGRGEPPESLVRRSFEYLLAREPKESILSTFELPVIARYFPDYEREITRRSD